MRRVFYPFQQFLTPLLSFTERLSRSTCRIEGTLERYLQLLVSTFDNVSALQEGKMLNQLIFRARACYRMSSL
jgi:hypothetical protein